MTDAQLADLSRVLYSPVTLALYTAAAIVLLAALSRTVGGEVDRGGALRRLGRVLAGAGIAAHVAHEVVRGLAQDRLPLGNMFEVTSLMALVGVAGGLWYLRARRRPELEGFVLLGGTLLLGLALLMYAEPGPLMPILTTWWRTFHVSLLVGGMGVFAAGFLFTALYLMRVRVDGGSDGGAAADGGAPTLPADAPGAPGAPSGGGTALAARPAAVDLAAARARIPAGRLAAGTFLGASTVSWVWAVALEPVSAGLTRMLTVNLALVAAALVARWFAPYLPEADVLDGIAHRTVAFAFVLWTVGTIAGAMWAEQSWGRFWGWDPKETGAFLTWVAYAGYLHGRATRGVRGERAAWIGVAAFVTLMATYLVANYVIVGLHSYAGL
jgi:ABC-type transport system involved in cytochrome c biogenesis permease subunit